MPEREPVEHHDQSPNPEEETPAYGRADRFQGEKEARRSYFAAQRLIRDPDVDLSAYRFQLNKTWHVAVLGPALPPEEIAQKVEEAPLPRGIHQPPTRNPPDTLRPKETGPLPRHHLGRVPLPSWRI